MAMGGNGSIEAMKQQRAMQKRIAVAAEAITSAADIRIPDVPKTEYAQRLIGAWEDHIATLSPVLAPCQ
jgi:hypothetical protein